MPIPMLGRKPKRDFRLEVERLAGKFGVRIPPEIPIDLWALPILQAMEQVMGELANVCHALKEKVEKLEEVQRGRDEQKD